MNNERILVSRNKREGEYYGKESYCRLTGDPIRPRRARAGAAFSKLSLKRRRIVWDE